MAIFQHERGGTGHEYRGTISLKMAVEQDDAAMEKYLDDEEPSSEDVKKMYVLVQTGCLDNTLCRFCGSAFKNKGVQRLFDAIVELLPSPKDVSSIKGVSTQKTKRFSQRA